MSKIDITVEFSAGTSILEACQEAHTKVFEWNVRGIRFKFNGIHVYICKNSAPEEIAQHYLDGEFLGGDDHKFIL